MSSTTGDCKDGPDIKLASYWIPYSAGFRISGRNSGWITKIWPKIQLSAGYLAENPAKYRIILPKMWLDTRYMDQYQAKYRIWYPAGYYQKGQISGSSLLQLLCGEVVSRLTLSPMAGFQSPNFKVLWEGGKTKFLEFFFHRGIRNKGFARSKIFRYGSHGFSLSLAHQSNVLLMF